MTTLKRKIVEDVLPRILMFSLHQPHKLDWDWDAYVNTALDLGTLRKVGETVAGVGNKYVQLLVFPWHYGVAYELDFTKVAPPEVRVSYRTMKRLRREFHELEKRAKRARLKKYLES